MEDKYSKQKKRITSVLFFVLQRYYFGFLQVAMSLIKYFRNNSNKESNEAPASSSADEPICAKRWKTIPKRIKWNEDYIYCRFFRPKGEEANSYHQPSVCSA